MRRFFSEYQRRILALKAGGRCQMCGVKLSKDFHADHIIPISKGGKTLTPNGQALCPTCNLQKSDKTA